MEDDAIAVKLAELRERFKDEEIEAALKVVARQSLPPLENLVFAKV